MATPMEQATGSEIFAKDDEEARLARLFKTVSAAIDRPDRRVPNDMASLAKAKLMPLLQCYVIFSRYVLIH